MESMFIQATSKTPGIDFNPESGILAIRGRSTPEDSRAFYKPIIAWCEDYSKKPAPRTVVEVRLDHFDTSSSKGLLDFLKRLKAVRDLKKEIEIIWHYESGDEDILEAGENFKQVTGLPFRMSPY